MTTENFDFGATSQEGEEIAQESWQIASRIVGDDSPEGQITTRCVIATGDSDIKHLVNFNNNPIESGLDALKDEAPIYVDINMVKVGITEKGHNSKVDTAIGKGDEKAEKEGITRTSAGFLELGPKLNGSIIVIGNSPSALYTVCDMMAEGLIDPRLVIGMPVGFVGAQDSKARLDEMDVPSITITGSKGGTPMAVTTINGIIEMHRNE
ncbi:precorrin-8X methylmutase [Methanonatronarchaeum sp. AMET6-2]|uniref:precorrin-8X methylmutase n=1 Tax=Methanonatronarchaeum sp. AMET6-2 TaxID=2933293 RepID=UPI001223CFFF|nr:precorrin-8X methylmutase [Methanonatronarchaeum sp. AMET6-2]RZN63417.1 MAG: precorrin-8X methylmutase [Methanonatronarchaeia archaeon]UOY10084.1 precorrin-8X methylmutase [Methanonatronarchaeum sp. AMET6-2]